MYDSLNNSSIGYFIKKKTKTVKIVKDDLKRIKDSPLLTETNIKKLNSGIKCQIYVCCSFYINLNNKTK